MSMFTSSVKLHKFESQYLSHSVCKQVQSTSIKLVNIFILLGFIYLSLSMYIYHSSRKYKN